MKSHPILFSGPMVNAILAGTKCQTRRLVKPQPDDYLPFGPYWNIGGYRIMETATNPLDHPYAVGGQLWVREQLRRRNDHLWVYASDAQAVVVKEDDATAMFVWAHHKEQDSCPSIHMPRWASRITIEVTGLRYERLQEISESDAMAEGITYAQAIEMGDSYPAAFRALWHTIQAAEGPHGWAANPLVRVVEFRRLA